MKILELVNLGVEDTKIINASQASRSELCGEIFKGGITPTNDLIKAVDEISEKPIRVLIRPNGVDFQVTENEFIEMKKTILFCKTMKNVDGVVFSIITKDQQIDEKRNQELVELAKPLKAIFCKGFDYLKNSYQFINSIYEMGFSGILTQGGLASIDENFNYLTNKLLTHPLVLDQKIEIIAAGGVGHQNIEKIATKDFKILHAGNLLREDLTYNTNLNLNQINQLTKKWKKNENEKQL